MSDETATATQPSADFVFGTLATDELRIAQLRAARTGVAHNQQIIPLDPQPAEPVTIQATTGPHLAATQLTCYYTIDGSDPQGSKGSALQGHAVPLNQVGVEWDTLQWGYVTHWQGQIPGQAAGTLVRYRIEAQTSDGSSHWAQEIAAVASGEAPAGTDPADVALFSIGGQARWPVRRLGSYAYHVDNERVPEWLRNAVIYQIFVDRFAPGGDTAFHTPENPSGFYGGTLRGIIEQLPYLHNLGITCLWLTPIFPSPTHHGYDATDYTTIEPRLGTVDDLRELTSAAHALGIHVVLDYVVNHMYRGHPAFQRAQADQNAPEAGWFTFMEWPERYLTFFDVRDMPQVNTDHPGATAYMVDSARFWLEQGVDGFRLDYANGPSHAFWAQFRAATRAAAPNSVTFGEVVETPGLQRSYAGRMDGCLDFVLMQALRQLFVFGTLKPSSFDAFLRQHLAFFPGDFVLPSFLDNHDMNRFLWVARGDMRRLRLAALCQFTLPNPPIIYYGTEVGLSQNNDVRAPGALGGLEQSRLPMRWGEAQNQELHTFYQQLIAFRRERPALWSGERTTILADDTRNLYAYTCAADGQTAIVIFNTGDEEQSVHLPTLTTAQLALTTTAQLHLEDGALILPPWSGAVMSL
jgi:cyclomaltodextrinase / maltogenic alpha-amylase / neopullulanase